MNGPSFQLAAAIRSYTAGHSLNGCDDDNCLLCAAAAALWMCEACEPVPVEGMPETLPGRGRPRLAFTGVNGRRGCIVCHRSLPLSAFETCSKRGNYRAQCRECRKAKREASRATADFTKNGESRFVQ